MKLENKVAIVTGGGGFIGSCTAKALAKEGAAVVVCDINEESAKKTSEAILSAGGISGYRKLDVTDSAAVNAAVDAVVAEYGHLDISIHIAGGSARIAGKDARFTSLVNQEDYVIDTVLKVNLYGALYVSRAAARQMIRQGTGGKIINFSSTVGINGLRNSTEYAAAKGGVIAMTKALAKELGEYRINVNSVAPGVVARPGNDDNEQYTLGTNFLHEKCLPEDVAALCVFLVSNDARFITGQTYVIDGGRSLCMKGSE